MTFANQIRNFFEFLKSTMRVTVDKHFKNFLHVVSDCILVVKVCSGAKNTMQIFLVFVVLH